MSERRALVAAVVVVGLSLVVLFLARERAPDGRSMSSPAPVVPEPAPSPRASEPSLAASATPLVSAPRAPAPSASAPPPPSVAAPVARAVVRPSSPRENLAIAMRLLEAGDDEAFRATFMPAVRTSLTTSAIEACRRRLVGKTLKPDWEVAESAVEPNEAGAPERVTRVSIFGKSMTGFHEVAPDEWLADAAWCVPVF